MDDTVASVDLDDDMVGPSMEGTKLRSNVYRTENADWKEIDVSKSTIEKLIFTYKNPFIIIIFTWFFNLPFNRCIENVGDNREWCSAIRTRHSSEWSWALACVRSCHVPTDRW